MQTVGGPWLLVHVQTFWYGERRRHVLVGSSYKHDYIIKIVPRMDKFLIMLGNVTKNNETEDGNSSCIVHVNAGTNLVNSEFATAYIVDIIFRPFLVMKPRPLVSHY